MARIVLVDDDPELRRLVELTLESVGHQVTGTSNPFEAVELVRRIAPHLAILDVRMPGRSGLEILRELAATPELAGVPVMLLSALKDSRSQIEGLELGAAEYLAKPFVPDELLARVERLLEPGRSGLDELEGDLRVLPLGPLFQSLERERFSGFLHLSLPMGEGTVCLRDGLVEAATWSGLSDREAVIALLGRQEGQFELETLDFGSSPRVAPLWSAVPLCLEAAWLADELRRRAHHLPEPGERLRRGTVEGGGRPEGFESLPIDALLERLEGEAATTLEALRARLPVAPQKIDLALAWLVEAGAVVAGAIRVAEGGAVPAFLDAAAASGYPRQLVRLLLACGEGDEGEVDRLITAEGGLKRAAAEASSALQFGASYRLTASGGELLVHRQVLSAATALETEALLPLCFGVVVWTSGLGALELKRVVDRLEKDRRPHLGLLLLEPGAADPAPGSKVWRTGTSRPASFEELIEGLSYPARGAG